jgi:uncharacterized membrane protein YjfL (UPF0719 family)
MSDQSIGLICGVVHLLLSFLLAIIATFGSFKIFDKLTKDIDEVEELKANNVAVGISLAAMLLSSAMVLKSVTSPAISTLQTYLYQGMDFVSGAKLVGFLVGYIAFAWIVAIGVIWFAISMFLKLTKTVDEFAEIKAGNVSVAIVFAVVILIMGLLLGDAIKSLFEAVIPFPSMQGIQVKI